ncbi:MAG: hypothetical protein Q8R55_00130 [Candidatus Taylorbacteria bacterium]|nr:hypothetical protein [Candidatus Taylorbacteria bacterium]
MSKSLALILLVLIAVAAFFAGQKYGDQKGYDRGLTDAARIQSAQEEEVQVDTGYRNPYEGVNLNPFK